MSRGPIQRRGLLLLLLLALLALAAVVLWHGDDEQFSLEDGRDRVVGGAGDVPTEGPELHAAKTATPSGEGAPSRAGATLPEASPSPASAAPTATAKAGDPGQFRLRVDVVHALTGMDVPAGWNFYPGPLDASGRPAPVAQEVERTSTKQRRDAEAGLVKWRREFLPSGALRKVGRKDAWTAPPIVLEDLPNDLVVPWDAPTALRADVAADAQVLVAVALVGPMAPLDVRVLEDGRLIRGAERRRAKVRVEHLTVGDVDWPLIEVVEHAAGLLRILGIPHRPGEPVAAHVSWLPPGTAAPAPSTPAEGRPQANLRTTMPELLPDGVHPWRTEVPSREPSPAPPEADFEPAADIVIPEAAFGNPDAPGELRLRVHGHDGRRLLPRELDGHSLDAEGRIVRKDVPSGPHDLHLTLPGRLPIEMHVEVAAGLVTEVVLHEPHGAELEVFVVDDLGQVRPSATIALPGRRWFDTDGPTQRIDLLTDHLGRRRIARVEPGRLTVHARWGSRRGSVEVNLVEDHLTRVTVVAR